jgi:hypothetical protein
MDTQTRAILGNLGKRKDVGLIAISQISGDAYVLKLSVGGRRINFNIRVLEVIDTPQTIISELLDQVEFELTKSNKVKSKTPNNRKVEGDVNSKSWFMEQLAAGRNYRQIASMIGVSESFVSQKAMDLGLDPIRVNYLKERKDLWLQEYLQDIDRGIEKTFHEYAKQWGCSRPTVSRLLGKISKKEREQI